jgi:hypothetical protein
LFADLDGAHFIANTVSFEPVEWQADIRVVEMCGPGAP